MPIFYFTRLILFTKFIIILINTVQYNLTILQLCLSINQNPILKMLSKEIFFLSMILALNLNLNEKISMRKVITDFTMDNAYVYFVQKLFSLNMFFQLKENLIHMVFCLYSCT